LADWWCLFPPVIADMGVLDQSWRRSKVNGFWLRVGAFFQHEGETQTAVNKAN
jgi:hypothetical protein